jgi:16S rRNA (uracil1498-N3)-methyltransferase
MHSMNLGKENLFLQPAFLSDVELYYSKIVDNNSIRIIDDEFHHIKDVMRHNIGDDIYITDGKGNIYKTKIHGIHKNYLTAEIIHTVKYKNELSNYIFCIPRLKNSDRFEFALEKCVELGITNFIVFDSQRTIAKGEKLERWQKILISAMKQSLRAWLPTVTYSKSVFEIMKLEGKKICFDQNTDQSFTSILNSSFSIGNYYCLFGPEGGFSNDELKMMNEELKVKLTENRVRSETAIIVAATVLAIDAELSFK